MDASRVRWAASLSDGSTVFQTDISWEELLKKCEDNALTIRQLRLQVCGTTIVAAKNSEGFLIATKVSPTRSNSTKTVAGLGTIIGENVFVNWIDESRNIVQEVQKVSDYPANVIYTRGLA